MGEIQSAICISCFSQTFASHTVTFMSLEISRPSEVLENCWHTKLASEVLVVVVLPALDALGFLHYIYVI